MSNDEAMQAADAMITEALQAGDFPDMAQAGGRSYLMSDDERGVMVSIEPDGVTEVFVTKEPRQSLS